MVARKIFRRTKILNDFFVHAHSEREAQRVSSVEDVTATSPVQSARARDSSDSLLLSSPLTILNEAREAQFRNRELAESGRGDL
jgi:hypothetical protein